MSMINIKIELKYFETLYILCLKNLIQIFC